MAITMEKLADVDMNLVDDNRLEEDLEYRFRFLAEAIGLNDCDLETLHQNAPIVATKVSAIVDAVYDRLLEFDSMRRHFMPNYSSDSSQFESPYSSSNQAEVDDSRKLQLRKYLSMLMTAKFDRTLLRYLENSCRCLATDLDGQASMIPMAHVNALLGFIIDATTSAIFELQLPHRVQCQVVRVFTKMMWIQGDLMTHHWLCNRRSITQ